MARVAKLAPKELPSGKWELNIPAQLSDTGKRRRCTFATKALAQSEADKLTRERNQWGVRAKHAEPHLVTEATAARDLLEPFGVGLLECARQWIARRQRLDASESVLDAFGQYEARMEREERSPQHRGSLRQLRTRLPDEFIASLVADIEPADIEKALDATSAGQSKWNLRRRELHSVFADSVRRGKALENPVSRVLSKKKAKAQRIDILTIAETKALIAACKGTIPAPKGRGKKPLSLHDALPAVAILLFAGLRPEEIRTLDWERVDLEERVIRLDGDETKTRYRRHVDITDNLAAWLAPHEKESGRVVPTYWPAKWTALRAKVAISDRRDVTRHSYGSAWWAIHRNVHELSFQMGNTPEVCRSHYVEHVPRREALKYWAIAPKGVKIPKHKVA